MRQWACIAWSCTPLASHLPGKVVPAVVTSVNDKNFEVDFGAKFNAFIKFNTPTTKQYVVQILKV